MDTEKLNTAADDYSKSLYESGMYDKETPATPEDMAYAFKGGAKWLQSQPLIDRLTDSEKNELRNLFMQMKQDYNRLPSTHNTGMVKAMLWVDETFGNDFLRIR